MLRFIPKLKKPPQIWTSFITPADLLAHFIQNPRIDSTVRRTFSRPVSQFSPITWRIGPSHGHATDAPSEYFLDKSDGAHESSGRGVPAINY